MRRKVEFVLLALIAVVLQGCLSMQIHAIRKEQILGKNIDEVKKNVERIGYDCRTEDLLPVGKHKGSLMLGCTTYGRGSCPDTHTLLIIYEPETRQTKDLVRYSTEFDCGISMTRTRLGPSF